jgi:hypothetical protein
MPALAPSSRTWAAKDAITTTRLRASLGNAAAFLTQRPTLIAAQATTAQALTAGAATQIQLDTDYLDNRSGHAAPAAQYTIKVPGWYLCEGDLSLITISAADFLNAGVQASRNSVLTTDWGGVISSNGSGSVAATCADLCQLDPSTADAVFLLGQTTATGKTVANARFKAEWVALPTSLASGNGTVVASPPAATLWPPGAGTIITNAGGIGSGATSMTVGSAIGMMTGGTLGLGWLNGVPNAVAETVAITSVAGTTIGITATLHAHPQGEPVAVPVSAAFLNAQGRDLINFAAYPPIASLNTTGTAATLPSQTFPAGTAITFLASTVDNFGGWNSGVNPTRYTFPVAGVYYVYGQVAVHSFSGAYALCAGLAVSGGTTAWGTTIQSSSTASNYTATVRRAALRVTAGQYVELIGSQNSGSAISLAPGGAAFLCRMIIVFRGF